MHEWQVLLSASRLHGCCCTQLLGAWDDDVYMPPTHRDPYRFKKKIELCLFIELVSGVMSLSVANAVETDVAACS